MNNNLYFNKEKFALLLEEAKGEMSINKYARESGVSAAHISRFLRQLIDNPPSPVTISKLIEKSSGRVTYEDMMIASGYSYEKSKGSPLVKNKEDKAGEEYIFQLIVNYLMGVDFKWLLKKPDKQSIYDIVVETEGEYSRSLYKCVYMKEGLNIDTSTIKKIFGEMVMEKIANRDKVIIATNNEVLIKFLKNNPPVNLNLNLYLMLVNLNNKRVESEVRLIKIKNEF